MAAAREEEGLFTEAERDVAAILCGLKKALRARDRRRMQRLREAPPEIPCWGRRRPRSMPEEKPAASASPAAAAETTRDGAASPDTPLAYPESGGDDAPPEEKGSNKPAPHEQWVQEQHGVVASLSQENAHLLKVKREQDEQDQQEQALKRPRLAAPAAADPRAAAAALGLDLNEPARASEEEARARAHAQAMAAAAAAEWYRQVHLRAAMQKAAVSAGARRRRLEILRAKVSSRPRRAG